MSLTKRDEVLRLFANTAPEPRITNPLWDNAESNRMSRVSGSQTTTASTGSTMIECSLVTSCVVKGI